LYRPELRQQPVELHRGDLDGGGARQAAATLEQVLMDPHAPPAGGGPDPEPRRRVAADHALAGDQQVRERRRA
jgi:hypothetical protein